MQKRCGRSDLELRGPKSGLEIGPRSSRGVRSALELRGPETDLEFNPRRSCPGGSASFRTLDPMVTTKLSGGCAGGADGL
eukprot:2460590-Alexandrium_andersonii.AAC.1